MDGLQQWNYNFVVWITWNKEIEPSIEMNIATEKFFLPENYSGRCYKNLTFKILANPMGMKIISIRISSINDKKENLSWKIVPFRRTTTYSINRRQLQFEHVKIIVSLLIFEPRSALVFYFTGCYHRGRSQITWGDFCNFLTPPLFLGEILLDPSPSPQFHVRFSEISIFNVDAI